MKMVYLKTRKAPITWDEAKELLLRKPEIIHQFQEVSNEIASYTAVCVPQAFLALPQEFMTPVRLVVFVIENPMWIHLLPQELLSEELLLLSLQNNSMLGGMGINVQKLPKELFTDEVIDAYIAAGGLDMSAIPEEKVTEEMADEVAEWAAETLPKRLQTKERWAVYVQNVPAAIEFCPEELLSEELCLLAASSKYGNRSFGKIPKKFRTEAVLMAALTNRGIGQSVATVLRMAPAASKTDKALEVAYEELQKEIGVDRFSLLRISATAGKVFDKKFAQFIEKKEAEQNTATPAAEVPVTDEAEERSFTNEELSGLYQALYEMNLAGMDPEFLDLYEGSYAPENVLADGMSQENLYRAINSLISELVDDLGSEDMVKEWFLECGGTAKLYEDVGHAGWDI